VLIAKYTQAAQNGLGGSVVITAGLAPPRSA
jgi:hypothetical protein